MIRATWYGDNFSDISKVFRENRPATFAIYPISNALLAKFCDTENEELRIEINQLVCGENGKVWIA